MSLSPKREQEMESALETTAAMAFEAASYGRPFFGWERRYHDDVTDLRAEIARLRARVEKTEKALRPFKTLADTFDYSRLSEVEFGRLYESLWPSILAARAALAGDQP